MDDDVAQKRHWHGNDVDKFFFLISINIGSGVGEVEAEAKLKNWTNSCGVAGDIGASTFNYFFYLEW